MAMIDCHECGKPVSTEARACPHCGAKAKATPGNRLLWGLLGLIALVALIATFGTGSSPFPH